MDFSLIKQNFAIYLEAQNDPSSSTKKYDTSSADFNIFKYANEFKTYLTQEYRTDESIQSMSVNDILDMEIEGGNLVNPDKVNDY
ncbi:hypothetical protein II906_03810, partial [bacterium]|nr:hypothetical protein [bacterium]